ncbi:MULTISPECIES: alpha/beta hydrolase [unclassified Streptomyces]|uniref:alpha/beta hydrolase n=1 Tax=unclassified Streptomyces TaxID=2593676 RepID=UPI0019049F47|nr:alpha/beta fold hydrolase [Streptomyces sp. HSG2]
MAEDATSTPGARLGRALGTYRGPVGGVVLLLPAGDEHSHRRPSPLLATAGMFRMGRRLVRAGREEGLAAHVVHYRCRGWNGPATQQARDAAQAADQAIRRYGDVPVCLLGHDMGGRAALRAAGHEAVGSVVAIAPWLPEDDGAGSPEPVKQLGGRSVLIVHGTDDERVDPELSFRLAARAKKANREVCRFEAHSDGHALHHYRGEVAALAVDFVLGTLFGRPLARPVQDALMAPPPLGLRMPLAAGFGSSRRR